MGQAWKEEFSKKATALVMREIMVAGIRAIAVKMGSSVWIQTYFGDRISSIALELV